MNKFSRDVFDAELSYSIEESDSVVDGVHILGRIRGSFFVPNGVSRNNRFYPSELWQKVISNKEITETLKDKRMFGTFGHDQVIDEKAMADGLISHIVTDLRIEGNKGVGEAIILGTKSGSALNTYLRAGTKLYVSSRADGMFKGEVNGLPRVDPDTYQLTGFDIVLDPGFLQAQPDLVESVGTTLENNKTRSFKGDNKMDEKLLESIIKENASVKSQLESALTEVQSLTAKNVELTSTVESLSEATTSNKKLREALVNYKRMGTPSEIKEALESSMKLLSEYKAIGTPAQINKAIDASIKKLEAYAAIGTPARITKAIDASIKKLEAYSAIGTPARINTALDKAVAVVEAYKKFGTLKEVGQAFSVMEGMVTKMKSTKATNEVKRIASDLDVSEAAVAKLYGKLSVKEIKEVLGGVAESNKFSNKFVSRKTAEITETTSGKKELKSLSESSAKRLMRSFMVKTSE